MQLRVFFHPPELSVASSAVTTHFLQCFFLEATNEHLSHTHRPGLGPVCTAEPLLEHRIQDCADSLGFVYWALNFGGAREYRPKIGWWAESHCVPHTVPAIPGEVG